MGCLCSSGATVYVAEGMWEGEPSRSPAAFTEVTHRYVDLVYSAAIRMVRDPHLAQDISQNVFLALAKSAAELTERPVLAGWLHRTTHHLAVKSIRSDVRRRAREQE